MYILYILVYVYIYLSKNIVKYTNFVFTGLILYENLVSFIILALSNSTDGWCVGYSSYLRNYKFYVHEALNFNFNTLMTMFNHFHSTYSQFPVRVLKNFRSEFRKIEILKIWVPSPEKNGPISRANIFIWVKNW